MTDINIKDLKSIKTFSDLLELSLNYDTPLICLLEAREGLSLSQEVIEAYLRENKKSFQFLKIEGATALDIRFDLAIIKLPAVIIFFQGKMEAYSKGAIASHELIEMLSNINPKLDSYSKTDLFY